MLRIHFIQHWFNLADLSCEKALYDSASLCRFVGIDLGAEPVPDATTILKFRHLLDKHKLGAALFARVGKELQTPSIKVNTGSIVDATIIGAPSTNNANKARDPEMHQSRTSFWGGQAAVGIWQGALTWFAQERNAGVRGSLGAGQHLSALLGTVKRHKSTQRHFALSRLAV